MKFPIPTYPKYMLFMDKHVIIPNLKNIYHIQDSYLGRRKEGNGLKRDKCNQLFNILFLLLGIYLKQK